MQNKYGNKPCLNSCVILANDKHVSKATYHHNLNWWEKLSHPMEREAITTEEVVYLFLTMQLIVSPINTNKYTNSCSKLSKIHYHCSLYSVSDLATSILYRLTPTHRHMCAITTDLSGSCDCITEQSLFSRKFPYSQRVLEGQEALFAIIVAHSSVTALKMQNILTRKMRMLPSKTAYWFG